MNTVNEDFQHLKLLSIFHYVVAGLAALFALFPLIHLAIGIGMVTGSFASASKDPSAHLMGWFFIAFAGVWMICGAAFAVCLFIAARCLSRHTRYVFCLVMAGIECIFMPFGTVLGIFTIIVLLRESVKTLFGRTS